MSDATDRTDIAVRVLRREIARRSASPVSPNRRREAMFGDELQGPKAKCRAILMTEDDGDVVCQDLLPLWGLHQHHHTTPEGRKYQW